MKASAFFLCVSVTAALLSASALAKVPRPLDTVALPMDWYPESVAVGADGTFYVGSWRQGAVARLRPGAVKAEILVAPGSNGLANGQGLLLDGSHHLLWICSGTIGFTTVPMTPSALKSYDLETGAPRGSYLMPDQGYCNDLAQDRAGRIYVSDSLHPRVLCLNPRSAKLDVWLESPAFSTGAAYFLNGIAIDAEQRLYLSPVQAEPYLLRVPIDRDGKAGEVKRIPAPRSFKNADAIRTIGNDELAIFESNAFGHDGPYGGEITLARVEGDRISKLTSLVAGLNDPSSGVVFADRVYFIESKYSLLISHGHDDAAVPRNVPFDLQSLALPK